MYFGYNDQYGELVDQCDEYVVDWFIFVVS